MSSPWSASRDVPFEAPRALIERAHDELIAGNLDDRRLRLVRPLVRASWERARQQHVGADGLPPLELNDDELERYRNAHPLATAMEVIRSLLLPGDPAESGVIVAVGDHAGRLLWVEGDLSARLKSGEMGFVAGANWSEEVVGTAAPGTALVLGKSVQIHGAEHYNRLVQPWSCTAAPVFDPESRHILGVIDITGGAEVATMQARLLVDATARAVESELLVARLRARATLPQPPQPSATPKALKASSAARPTRARAHLTAPQPALQVLGRDRAGLTLSGMTQQPVTHFSARHTEILLMLALHPHGLSADRLSALVYGEGASVETVRPEIVRLRRVLQSIRSDWSVESRPYRLSMTVETDAQHLLSLLDRGAHRVALTAYRGPVLPASIAPGVEDFREAVRAALREAMLTEASVEVLLSYADLPEGAGDLEVLRLCLEMLPPRSPKRVGLVARIAQLERP